MCTAALYQELDRYIFEDYDSPMDMYHKTHSFPSDVFLNAKNELEIALEKALEDYLPVPSNIVKKIEIRAYLELREHLFLNFSRTLLTRQWIVIAGSIRRLSRMPESPRCSRLFEVMSRSIASSTVTVGEAIRAWWTSDTPHFRVHHGENEFARGNSHINGIESFWAYAKLRLAKLKGIPAKTFPLHLKETEFRFNHRQDNLYRTLLRMFRENPL